MRQEAWRSQRAAEGSWVSTRVPKPLFRMRTPEDSNLSAIGWTRATTRSSVDYQGNVVLLKAGEFAWHGYRRVENLVQRSDDLTHASWTKSSTTASSATLLLATASTATHYCQSSLSLGLVVQELTVLSVLLRKHSDSWIQVGGAFNSYGLNVWVNVNLDTGELGNSGSEGAYSIRADAEGGWIVSVVAAVTAGDAENFFVCFTGNANVSTRAPSVATTTSNGVYVDRYQVVRARPGQTEADESVSVGVLAAPYHGHGVDGVCWFATDHLKNVLSNAYSWERSYSYGPELISSNLDAWSAGGAFGNHNPLSRSGNVLSVIHNPSSSYSIRFDCVPNATYLVAVMGTLGSGVFDVSISYSLNGTTYAGVAGSTKINAPIYFRVPAGAIKLDLSITSSSVAGSGANLTFISATARRWLDADTGGTIAPSHAIAPIPRGLSVNSLQTNRLRYSNEMRWGNWTKRGQAAARAIFDAQVGMYSQLRRLGVAGTDDCYQTNGGFTANSRTEVALMLRAVSTTGSLKILNPYDSALGSWTVDLAQVSTTRFERIDRFHPAVTIAYEFYSQGAGSAGVHFVCYSGFLDVDVSWVTQVQGALVDSLIYTESEVATVNADLPLISNLYPGSSLTLLLEYSYKTYSGDVESGVFSYNSSASTDKIDFRSEGRYLLVQASGSNQAVVSIPGAARDGRYRVVIKAAPDNFSIKRSGNTLGTDTAGLMPVLNQLQLGGLDKGTGYNLRNLLHEVAVFQGVLSDAQTQFYGS